MSERAPYSRVYWSVQHDEKFDGIREDMRLMGSWLTLLIIADQSWPAPSYPPPIVPKSALKALTEAGLIDAMSGGRYRVHGLDGERARRKAAATNGDPRGTQEGPKRDPGGEQAKQSREEDEKRRAEQSIAARGPSNDPDDGRTDLEAFLLVTRRAPTPRQRKLLDGLLDRHDLTGPDWAADIIMKNPDDPIGAVIEADKAWRAQRIAEARTAESPKPTPRRPHGLPQATRDILAEMQRLDQEKRGAA